MEWRKDIRLVREKERDLVSMSPRYGARAREERCGKTVILNEKHCSNRANFIKSNDRLCCGVMRPSLISLKPEDEQF